MRSSPLITRVSPVTVNVALERMSSELLPALGIVNLSSPRAIFAGSPPRFTRSRVTYEAYAVSRTSHTTSIDGASQRPSTKASTPRSGCSSTRLLGHPPNRGGMHYEEWSCRETRENSILSSGRGRIRMIPETGKSMARWGPGNWGSTRARSATGVTEPRERGQQGLSVDDAAELKRLRAKTPSCGWTRCFKTLGGPVGEGGDGD